jgi:hypothetical protein
MAFYQAVLYGKNRQFTIVSRARDIKVEMTWDNGAMSRPRVLKQPYNSERVGFLYARSEHIISPVTNYYGDLRKGCEYGTGDFQ